MEVLERVRPNSSLRLNEMDFKVTLGLISIHETMWEVCSFVTLIHRFPPRISGEAPLVFQRYPVEWGILCAEQTSLKSPPESSISIMSDRIDACVSLVFLYPVCVRTLWWQFLAF